MLYENVFERIYSLLLDLLIFLIKSLYYIGESLYLTLLPDRFRQMKVSAMNFCRIVCIIVCLNNSTVLNKFFGNSATIISAYCFVSPSVSFKIILLILNFAKCANNGNKKTKRTISCNKKSEQTQYGKKKTMTIVHRTCWITVI